MLTERVLHDVAWRAMHLHGALGVTDEMPLMALIEEAAVMGSADGPTEVHTVTVARQVLRDHQPTESMFLRRGYRRGSRALCGPARPGDRRPLTADR